MDAREETGVRVVDPRWWIGLVDQRTELRSQRHGTRRGIFGILGLVAAGMGVHGPVPPGLNQVVTGVEGDGPQNGLRHPLPDMMKHDRRSDGEETAECEKGVL